MISSGSEKLCRGFQFKESTDLHEWQKHKFKCNTQFNDFYTRINENMSVLSFYIFSENADCSEKNVNKH